MRKDDSIALLATEGALSAAAREATCAEEIKPLRSQHTASFAGILKQHAISIAVTTYQTGHLVLMRADGTAVNTHFRRFPRPMGMAYRAGRAPSGWPGLNVLMKPRRTAGGVMLPFWPAYLLAIGDFSVLRIETRLLQG